MFKAFILQVRLTWRLLRDPRVPLWAKAIPMLPLVYVVSPIDVIPDIIPILGQLDDLTLIIAGMRAFEALVPEDIVLEHKRALEQSGNDVIEGRGEHINTESDR
jgi:uncharacterized membrane protein YkvA (DUF1232 family)